MTVESDIKNGTVQQQGADVVKQDAEVSVATEVTQQQEAQSRSLPSGQVEDWNEKLKSVFSLKG